MFNFNTSSQKHTHFANPSSSQRGKQREHLSSFKSKLTKLFGEQSGAVIDEEILEQVNNFNVKSNPNGQSLGDSSFDFRDMKKRVIARLDKNKGSVTSETKATTSWMDPLRTVEVSIRAESKANSPKSSFSGVNSAAYSQRCQRVHEGSKESRSRYYNKRIDFPRNLMGG
jgi:hypothetical protein